MKIIIHRGTHEIGGSCVEIQSKKSRILIDIGMPLVKKDGDRFNFKEYGRKQKAFQWFLDHAPENIDVLLLEGTVLDRGLKGKGVKEFKSETEIEDESEFSFFIGSVGE